jgi:hypothetical protein
MHAGPRTGFPHDRSGAADMIRVAVSEIRCLIWSGERPSPRIAPKDDCLLTRETGVDQRQPVVALNHEGV